MLVVFGQPLVGTVLAAAPASALVISEAVAELVLVSDMYAMFDNWLRAMLSGGCIISLFPQNY